MPRIARPGYVPALATTLILALSSGVAAHEIPADISVRLLVKPEGQRLRLLARAPLAAMRDVESPKRGPGYLDLARADASLRNAAMLWIADPVRPYEDGERLEAPRNVAVWVSLPADRSFGLYEQALAHVADAPLPGDTEIYWNQALLDVRLEYPIHSDRSEFSIDPAFASLAVRVVTVLGFLPPDGGARPFEFAGDPGLVRLDPRWPRAALRFVDLGSLHILGGIEHRRFLLCLVIPLRRMLSLAAIVTSFTVAHSVTLIASAFDVAPGALWFPSSSRR